MWIVLLIPKGCFCQKQASSSNMFKRADWQGQVRPWIYFFIVLTVRIWMGVRQNMASQVALVVKTPPAGGIRDMGWIPRLGTSPGGGHGNPLQYSCLENYMDRGTWWATVHRVTKSQTWLKQLNMHNTMSKLKNSTQRFNNRLDQRKEKDKRINVLEERLVESIQIEEPKENERNIESQWTP